MTEFNPLAGAILSSAHTQRQLSLDKSRQRRRQVLEKDAAASDDQLEHQVESADAVAPIEEQLPERNRQQPSGQPLRDQATDDRPHIDVTG